MQHIKLNWLKVLVCLLSLIVAIFLLLKIVPHNIYFLKLIRSESSSPFKCLTELNLSPPSCAEKEQLVTLTLANNNQIKFQLDGENTLLGVEELPENRVTTHFARGMIAWRNGNFSTAYEAWQKNDNQELYFLELSRLTGGHDKAVELLEIAVEIEPSSQGFFALAERLRFGAEFEDAERAYLEAYSHSSKNKQKSLIALSMGHNYLALDRLDLSSEYYLIASEDLSVKPSAVIGLAQIDKRMGDYGGALEKLTDSLPDYPDHPRLLFEVALLEYQQQNYSLALEHLSRINPSQLSFYPAFRLLAELSIQLEDETLSCRAYQAYQLFHSDQSVEIEVRNFFENLEKC